MLLKKSDGLLVAVALTLTAGCGEETASPGEGANARECEDRRDNDGDGLVDCDDDGCEGQPICGIVSDSGNGDGGSSDAGDATADDTVDGGADPDTAIDSGEDAPDTGADAEVDAGPDADTAGDDATNDADGDDTAVDDGIRSCETHFEVTVGNNASQVWIAGEFTDWATAMGPLTDADNDDTWEIDLELPPGEHAYKFVYDVPGEPDAVWDFQGNNEIPSWVTVDFYTQWVDGTENRSVIVGDCTIPLLTVESASSDDDGVYAELRFERGTGGAALAPESVEVTVGGEPVEADVDATTGTISINVTGLPDGKHSIRATATDVDGQRIENDPVFIPLWVEDEPFEWRDATMYFVFTDRFRNSDAGADIPQNEPIADVPTIANYQGGDFAGVIAAIEEGYFDELGVNLLWLSPVQENPEGNWLASDRVHQFSGFHGYWPTSAREIEFRWGDLEGTGADRLKQLIDTAHEHGIRVMFDIALNHVHQDHDYIADNPGWFTAAPCNCTSSPGPCNWDTNPLFCWFIDYLPDLNYRNHEIVQQVAADVEWLVTEFDVDAFRIDAAKHMDHVIMRRVSMRLQERFVDPGGAPFYLVGETYTFTDGHGLIMKYVNDHELDGQFDFPLLYPIRDAFAYGASFRNLATGRATSESQYGGYYDAMSPFLGNHDIPRLAQLIYNSGSGIDPWAGVPDPMAGTLGDAQWNIINRMSMGFAFVLTQPGVPLIYYGDEIGLYGGADPDNRRMMTFEPFLSDGQSELLSRIQAIGRARRELEALRRGEYVELWVDDNFYVYARDNGDGDVVIVAMNKGAGRAQGVPVPAASLPGINGVTFENVLTDTSPRQFTVTDNNATITLDSWEYAIYAPVR